METDSEPEVIASLLALVDDGDQVVLGHHRQPGPAGSTVRTPPHWPPARDQGQTTSPAHHHRQQKEGCLQLPHVDTEQPGKYVLLQHF